MAKDAYYFSHDSNASQDPKILQMRSVYGAEGYGWYWMLIEMMREQDDFRLPISGKYAMNAYAMHMQCDCIKLASFIDDCVDEFHLFLRDENYIWSESLIRRMSVADEKSQKAKKAAAARWGKDKKEESSNCNGSEDCANADAMQAQCECNADASKSDARKERKGKEKKGNEMKESEEGDLAHTFGIFSNVVLSDENHVKLKDQFEQTKELIDKVSEYLANSTKVYKNHYALIRKIAREDNWPRRPKPRPEDEPAAPIEAVPMPEEIREMLGGMFKPPE